MVLRNEQYRMKLNGVKTPNKQFNKHLIRDGPLENLSGGVRAKYKKKYSRKANLNEKKFMHAN